jgi:hypothetical protein
MSETRSQIRKMVAGLALFLILGILGGAVATPSELAHGQVTWLPSEQIVVTTTDDETSTSENSTQALNGHVYAIYLDFGTSVTTTTDITITQASPEATIFQATDYYTDTWLYPAIEYTSSAGAGLSAYAPMPLMDEINIAVGQTVTGTTIVTATVLWGE